MRRFTLEIMALVMATIALTACTTEAPVPPGEAEMTLSLSSAAFQNGEAIPVKYTCQGQNISPPLTWSAPPQETQGFALIMDDLDAPGGVSLSNPHIWGLPSGQ